jgi:lysophospholipase L1-like esterase
MRPARTRLLGATVALTVCAMGSFAVAVESARAASITPVTTGSRYLALGDSVTFGYEESGVVPTPNYHDAASFLGYPEQLGAALHVTVANAACPGETSASLINASAQSNGCENAPHAPNAAYRKAYPLHVHYKGSQLAYALSYLHAHSNVALVSLMIGANDYFVCTETTSDSCASHAEQHAVLTSISRNVKRILTAIRNTAHYRGQLVIVNYYSLDYASAATNAMSISLNNAEDSAAKPFGARIANGYAEFEAQARHYGDSPCLAGLITELGKLGDCGIHPSYTGQALLAQAVEKAIAL